MLKKSSKDIVGVGIVGAGFMGGVHAISAISTPRSFLRAVADIDTERLNNFAKQYDIPAAYSSCGELLKDPEVDFVVVCVPNAMHYPVANDALQANKHVLVEKPLAFSLAEIDALVHLAESRKLILAYGEQICFAPKFLRARQLAMDSIGMGKIYHIRQVFKTGGPDTPWYRQPQISGGGVTLDLACHGIECCRWLLGKEAIRSVFAEIRRISSSGSPIDDFALLVLEFENGVMAHIETSWNHRGGEDIILEIHGERGQIHADIWKGMGLRAYTDTLWKDAWEPNTGWVYPEWEWILVNGYIQQMAHNIDAILHGKPVDESGIDGRHVLEVVLAAYHSASTGKKVDLPFQPHSYRLPIELWDSYRTAENPE